jgi:CRISPR-associated protein Cmr6
MTTPLYQQHQAPNAPPNGSHLGLWYTRFFNRYNGDWTLDDKAKQEWVKSIANKQCGDEKTLKQHALRSIELLKALKGKTAICETNWHFVTGLGLPHPVENGFTWHQTLSVPFIAGSAIKGLLRAWVEIWEELDKTDREQRLKDWFGDLENAGKLIFFDAIPIAPVRLKADIMTPHYAKWYEKGQENQGNDITTVLTHPERLPADWHDPVPVPFLVAKQAKFFIGIAARDIKNEAMVASALESLIAALQWLGAGAKTAAGYGHLVRNERTEQDLQEQINRRKPKIIKESPDYLTLLKKLENGDWKDKPDEQKAMAELIQKLMTEKKIWREKSNAKNPNRDKNYQRTLKVLKVLKYL